VALREDEVRRLGRPADADSAATRLKVLNEARVLFARDGLSNTTNRALADAAGLSPTAIYHYFSSKSELYEEVCRDVIDRVVDMFITAASSSDSLVTRLDSLFTQIGNINSNDPSVSAFIMGMSDEARRHPEIRDVAVSLQTKMATTLLEMIESAPDRDTLLRGASSSALADMLLASLGGFARLRVNTNDAGRPRAAAELLLRMMHHATRPPKEDKA
jgi:AcrR family transcriptional regulator